MLMADTKFWDPQAGVQPHGWASIVSFLNYWQAKEISTGEISFVCPVPLLPTSSFTDKKVFQRLSVLEMCFKIQK